jgi:hypothetical protein
MIEPPGFGDRAAGENAGAFGLDATPRDAVPPNVNATRRDGRQGGLQSSDTRIRAGDPPLGRNDALPLVARDERISFRPPPALLAACRSNRGVRA